MRQLVHETEKTRPNMMYKSFGLFMDNGQRTEIEYSVSADTVDENQKMNNVTVHKNRRKRNPMFVWSEQNIT